MNKATFFKLTALLLMLCMLLTLTVGCGASEEPASSQPESSSQAGFKDGGDLDVGDQNSTVSNGQTASKGEDNTISAEINSDATDQGGGLMVTDNDAVFRNIPSSLKGKTVVFADWGEANDAEYQKVVKKFTADTGIKVKMLILNQADFVSKVAAQIAANSAPDIAACNSTYPQALEIVQPLPSVFDVNDGFWDPRVSEATKVGNNYYFVNTYNSPFTGGYVVFYNKKIFSNNALTSPQDYYDRGEWSYENLFRCLQDVVKSGYKGGSLDGLAMAEQMGVSLINYDQKTGIFTGNATDSRLVKSLQYVADAREKGLTGVSLYDFESGQTGIAVAGTFGLKAAGRYADMAPSDIGVVPLPTSYEGKELKYMPLGYRGYGICKGAKNGEAAYYFLRYFLDLNKYDPAGAKIFANKITEKYYRQVQLPLFQKSPLFFEYYQGALSLIGKSYGNSEWNGVNKASASQIAIELSKMQNVVDTAASTASSKLKDYVK